MKQKSWHLNRREFLRGGGVALGLPFLEGMSWAVPAKELPKRMLVSYFAYGAYMPNGANGIPVGDKPHHEWSWWPCRDPGPLTFNRSSAPFEALKDDISYLRGLPNMVIMTPADENETRQMLYTGFLLDQPCAVRYPRGTGPGVPVVASRKACLRYSGSCSRSSTKTLYLVTAPKGPTWSISW